MTTIRMFPWLIAAALPAALPPAAVAQAFPDSPVVVIVKVPKPWYAPRMLVVKKMRDTVPQYEKVAGLNFKMFSLAQSDGQFGGLYFWRNQPSASAWFDSAWFERVRKERGAEADVRYFEAPVSLDNTPSGTPAQTDSQSVATLVLLPVPAGVTRQGLLDEFRAAIPLYQKVPGLLRKHFVVVGAGQAGQQFGGVYLWTDRASADNWFNSTWHNRVRTTSGTDARMEWFDTPILTPSNLAENQIEVSRP
jgi:heme-degrading monooxygenase HmoA